MKRISLKLIALLLACLCLLFTACKGTGDGPQSDGSSSHETDSGSEEETSNIPTTPPEGATTYNIIFALASIPPVLAAIDSIANGNETYAIIERGKTYSGIDSLEHFHNAGFDPANNLSTGFTATEFDTMVGKVKELKENATGEVFFNFYVQDGTALRGAAIAANAGLALDEFHVFMCEDGTGAYHALYESFVKDKTVDATQDGVYDAYAARVEEMQDAFDTVMSKTDNKNGDDALKYNIGKAFALAALSNFTYYIQDESAIVDILESTGAVKTKLLSAFGVEGYVDETDLTLNLKYQKISAGIAGLTDAQKADYLTLMYGEYYADTYAALTRTERAGEAAPAKKLVFIGSRHNGYPKFASDAAHGIGGLATGATVPESYAALDAKYKTPLLFASESDYTAFLAVLNDSANYDEGLPADVKNNAQVAVFNLYIDYIFTLKLTYALYGDDYDFIMKGHPREAIGAYGEWGNRYKITYGENNGSTFVYDKLLDNLLLAFHSADSTGKLIGMVPYGTAAENLAYLGAEISICGLPSSTYSGYDTDVDVLSIIAASNQDIAGTGYDEAESQVKARYEAGNLLYTAENGEKVTTVFLNTGNIYKAVAEIYQKSGNTALASLYTERFGAWLAEHHQNAVDINAQGFAVTTADNR